jgi:hypothetical protein
MLRTRQDPAPGALAHGPVTASQIERVRTQLTSAEQAVARDAARYWQQELRRALKELGARRGEPRRLKG